MSNILKKIKSKKLKDIFANKEYRAALNAAATLTCKRNVTISFEGEESYTDGNNITVGVFKFLENQTHTVIKSCLVACALHEAEHIASTDFKYLSKKRKEYEKNNMKGLYRFFFNIFNCIEDGRIENIHQDKYRSNIKYIRLLRKLWWEDNKIISYDTFEKRIKDNIKNINSNSEDKYTEEDLNTIIEKKKAEKKINDFGLWVCSVATTQKPPKDFDVIYDTDKDSKKFASKFQNKILATVDKNKSTENAWDLSEKIGQYLIKELNIDVVSLNIEMESSFGIPGFGIGCDGEVIVNSNPITEDLNKVEIDKNIDRTINDADPSTSDDSNNNSRSSYCSFKKNVITDIKVTPTKSPYTGIVELLRRQIRTILQMKLLKEQRGLRRGKINSKDLWKTSVERKDIFYKKREEFVKDIAVHLLIDCSGSMDYCDYVNGSGERISNMHIANRTAAIVEESFSPYVNLAITYFDHTLFTLRKFGDPSEESYVWTLQKDTSGGTNDFNALEYAFESFKNSKEKRKLIIIITDGLTNVQEVRKRVLKANKLRIRTVALGLGVNDKAFREMYDNFIGCDSVSLETQLINLLRKIL